MSYTFKNKPELVAAPPAGESDLREKMNAVIERSLTFRNVNLNCIQAGIDVNVARGIAASEFEPNKNDTAPFSFLSQLGALTNTVHDYLKVENTKDDSRYARQTNFVYWLAANLFKLNLHIANDPFSFYRDEKREEILAVNGSLMGAMGCDVRTASVLLNALKFLRECSARYYEAFLLKKEFSLNISHVLGVAQQLDSLGPASKFVSPAFAIALGYTQSIFHVGTTKELGANFIGTWKVESDGQGGYKMGTLVNGFTARFSRYAGAYAYWHVLNNQKLREISDVGEFNPEDKILLEVDNEIHIQKLPPHNWDIFGVDDCEAVLLPLIANLEGTNKTPRLAIFPIF